jgi:hypothetical protein
MALSGSTYSRIWMRPLQYQRSEECRPEGVFYSPRLSLGGGLDPVENSARLGGRYLVGKTFEIFREIFDAEDLNSLGFSADYNESLREKDDRFGKGSGDPPFDKYFPD